MRTVTIELPDDVAHRLEVRAAVDDLKVETGIVQLLTHLVEVYEDGRH